MKKRNLTYQKFNAFNSNGYPLSGGRVYTYAAGTTTPKATYADPDGTTTNPNPVVLDSRGDADIYLDLGAYKIVLKDASDNLIWERDNITGDILDTYFYYPHYDETNQGVTGGGHTIKSAIDSIGTNDGTIVLRHNSGLAQTSYVLDADLTIPSKIDLQIQKGAVITIGAKNAVAGEPLATGDGTTLIFSGTLSDPPLKRGSVTVHYVIGGVAYTATDDGTGFFSGTDCAGGVNCVTGEWSLVFSVAPDTTTNITIDYIPLYKLTISGGINLGLYRQFGGDGIVQCSSSVKDIYPEWFGVAKDGATDDSAAVQKAIDCAYLSGGVPVYFSPGEWLVHNIILRDNVTCYGAGYSSHLFTPTNTNLFWNLGIERINVDTTSRTYYSLSNISKGDSTLTFTSSTDAANFSAGELAFIRSTDNYSVASGIEEPYYCGLIKITAVDTVAGTVTIEKEVGEDVSTPLITKQNQAYDRWVENAEVKYLRLTSEGGGAAIRSRGAYNCRYHHLWITDDNGLLGNAFCYCDFHDIILTNFIGRIIEWKIGTVGSSLHNLVAYSKPGVSISISPIEFGEYARGIDIDNVDIKAPGTTVTTDLIHVSGTGSNIHISNVKGNFKSVEAAVIAQTGNGLAPFLAKDIKITGIDVSEASQGVRMCGDNVADVVIRDIKVQGVPEFATYGIYILGGVSTSTAGGDSGKNFTLADVDTSGYIYFSGVTIENLNISNVKADTIFTDGANNAANYPNIRGIKRNYDFFSSAFDITENVAITSTTVGNIYKTFTVPANSAWTKYDKVDFFWRLKIPSTSTAGAKEIRVSDGTYDLASVSLAATDTGWVEIRGTIDIASSTAYYCYTWMNVNGSWTFINVDRVAYDLTLNPLTLNFEAWLEVAGDEIDSKDIKAMPILFMSPGWI